jgi:hypothetical protein
MAVEVGRTAVLGGGMMQFGKGRGAEGERERRVNVAFDVEAAQLY